MTDSHRYSRHKLRQAVKLLRGGKAIRAIQLLKSVRRIKPRDPIVYFNLGLAWERLERWSEALRAYDAALRWDPALADAWVCKGIVRGRQGRFVEEVRCYNQALSLDPTHPMALYNKAVTFDDDLHKPQEALRYYDQVLRLHLSTHQTSDVWLRKCDLLLRLRRFVQADVCLHHLIRLRRKRRRRSIKNPGEFGGQDT
jgi:tetratricopeptide (TPR) repeat protein